MAFYSCSESQLWMGSLEPYMTEQFIKRAFKASGERPTVVRRMKSKLLGLSDYCFVHFESTEKAYAAMKKLNGTIIPKSSPPAKFQLNYSGTAHRPSHTIHSDFTLQVTNLSPNVDDQTLHKCFASRYRSLRSAKVIRDAVGFSKGYGFIKFSIEADQTNCLKEMNGFTGLGSNKIGVSTVTSRQRNWGKTEPSLSTNVKLISTNGEPDNVYDPNVWQSYSWQNHLHKRNRAHDSLCHTSLPLDEKDNLQLIDHTPKASKVSRMNEALLHQDADFWDAIESSKWTPVDEGSGYFEDLTQSSLFH